MKTIAGDPTRLRRAITTATGVAVLTTLLLTIGCLESPAVALDTLELKADPSSIRFEPSTRYKRGISNLRITVKNNGPESIRLCADSQHFIAKAWAAGSPIEVSLERGDFAQHLRNELIVLEPGGTYSTTIAISWFKNHDVDFKLDIVCVYDAAMYSADQISNHASTWTGVLFSRTFSVGFNEDLGNANGEKRVLQVQLQRSQDLEPLVLELNLPMHYVVSKDEPQVVRVNNALAEFRLEENSEPNTLPELPGLTTRLNVPITDEGEKVRSITSPVRLASGWIGFRRFMVSLGGGKRTEVEYVLWRSGKKLVVKAVSVDTPAEISDDLHALVVEVSNAVE